MISTTINNYRHITKLRKHDMTSNDANGTTLIHELQMRKTCDSYSQLYIEEIDPNLSEKNCSLLHLH